MAFVELDTPIGTVYDLQLHGNSPSLVDVRLSSRWMLSLYPNLTPSPDPRSSVDY